MRARVLAIDDDELILTALVRILRRDCDVVALSNARDALERIRTEAFDVILCDLMMPQMTGMDLHAALVEGVPSEAKKMIFMTGGTFTPNAQAFLESVTNVRLEKPFDSSYLRTLILERARRSPEPV